MNGSQKVDIICENRPQNTPKCPPEERDIMSKSFLVLVIIRVIPRTPVQNLMTQYWTDIKKKMYICKNRSRNTPKQSPAEGSHKIFFECSNHQGYYKNTCKKFHEKILNSSEVLDEHSQKWGQTLPRLPRRVMICKKNRAVTLKRNTKNVCTKFHDKILNDSQRVEVICQNRPQKYQKKAPSRRGAFFECIDHQYYTKNNCTKFHEKILNHSQEIK